MLLEVWWRRLEIGIREFAGAVSVGVPVEPASSAAIGCSGRTMESRQLVRPIPVFCRQIARKSGEIGWNSGRCRADRGRPWCGGASLLRLRPGSASRNMHASVIVKGSILHDIGFKFFFVIGNCCFKSTTWKSACPWFDSAIGHQAFPLILKVKTPTLTGWRFALQKPSPRVRVYPGAVSGRATVEDRRFRGDYREHVVEGRRHLVQPASIKWAYPSVGSPVDTIHQSTKSAAVSVFTPVSWMANSLVA